MLNHIYARKWILILICIFLFSKEGTAMAIEHLSLVTTPIMLRKGDRVVSQGTGFYYVSKDKKHGNIVFLITNHHVVTGHPPKETKSPIGDNIIFYFHKNNENPGDVKEVKFPLFTKEGKPIWLSSKEFPNADIAVIPIVTALYDGAEVSAISGDWAGGKLKVRTTSPVTLIGYPYGYYDKKNWLPIWKTGNIASEPEIDFEGEPLFLIDVSAFPGMSGSPAFATADGAYETVDGPTTVGRVRKFLGIYASMQMLEEAKYLEQIPSTAKLGIIDKESLQIGHIWRASLIDDIVKDINVEKYVEEIILLPINKHALLS